MVNRYTNRNIYSQFRPIDFNTYAALPLMYQQKENEAFAKAQENQVYINSLSKDRQAADELQQDINNRVNGLIDNLNQGYNPSIDRELIELKRYRDNLLNPGGKGYTIEQNLKEAQAYEKAIRDNKDLEEYQKQLAIQRSRENYKGYEQGAYNGYTPSSYVDVSKELIDLTSKVDSRTIKNVTGWTREADPKTGGYIWRNGTTKTSTVPKKVLEHVARNYALTDPRIRSFLNSESYLRNQDNEVYSNAVIENAVNLAVNTNYDRDVEYSEDIKFQNTPEWWYNRNPENDNIHYEKTPIDYINTEQTGLINSIDRIGTDKPALKSYTQGSGASGFTTSDSAPISNGQYSLSDLTSKERQEYDFIADGISKTLNYTLDKNSPEMQQKVKEYLSNNSNRPRQDYVITSDTYRDYGENSMGADGRNSEQQAEAIWKSRKYREYYDPETNQLYTYDEAVDEGLINEDDNKNQNQFEVVGRYDPRNHLTQKANIKTDALVSPYVINVSNGKTLYATRSEGERRTKMYQRDAEFNKAWSKMDAYLKLPVEIKNDGDTRLYGIKFPDGSYIINKRGKDGKFIESKPIKGDEELREYIY